ncbi:LysM peptidoglycan-binding domain-containing protein, partial [bacterium]|nr:LysM peptidoglycan-binding domain-containing protein [bacterium]
MRSRSTSTPVVSRSKPTRGRSSFRFCMAGPFAGVGFVASLCRPRPREASRQKRLPLKAGDFRFPRRRFGVTIILTQTDLHFSPILPRAGDRRRLRHDPNVLIWILVLGLLAPCSMLAPVVRPALAQDWQTHVVRRGENLTVIAEKYGATVQDLRDWNELRSDELAIGQSLRIPESDSEWYLVRRG